MADNSVPGTALSTQNRQINTLRLLRAANELEVVAEAAQGKLTRDEISIPWLRPLATVRHGDAPSKLLTRWFNSFAEELETVRRARNNVVYAEYLDDDNLEAAANIAERLRNLVEQASRTLTEGERPET